MKHCCVTGRRNHGGPLKRLLDETGTALQVAQLHDTYIMMMIMIMN
jgi:hypothetical protein